MTCSGIEKAVPEGKWCGEGGGGKSALEGAALHHEKRFRGAGRVLDRVGAGVPLVGYLYISVGGI